MRILITGAYGFIGTALVHLLTQGGHEVTAFTSRDPATARPALPVSRVAHGSLLEEESLRAAVRNVGAVVHLAALTRVRESFDRQDEYAAVNASGTAALLRAAQHEAQVADNGMHLVFASTGAVYDSSAPQPFTESSPLKPTNPYAQSKLQAEDLLRSASREAFGSQVTVLRLFNIAGAAHGRGDSDLSRIIPKTLAVAAGNAPAVQVNGDGSAVRDFVHVLDAARAIAAALQVSDPGAVSTYNVGATAASVADIIEVCGKVTGRNIAVEYLPPKPEPQVLLADCASIHRDLGWAPEHSDLPAIIADAWAAMTTRAAS